MHFFPLKFTFMCQQYDIVPIICHRCCWTRWQNLPRVLLIPAAICHRCRWLRQQICRMCRWHQWQFATDINNTSCTSGKIFRRCRWYLWQPCHWCRWCQWQICHRWCTFICEYLWEFSENFEMTLTLFSGAWGKMIHEKILQQKILWHCPFKSTVLTLYQMKACVHSFFLIYRNFISNELFI